MRVLVTGASGQLGYDVCRELEQRGTDFWGVSSKELDLTVPETVRACVHGYVPDAVIHCAAYTAVDRAEDDRDRCWAVNAEGTRTLARCCREVEAKLLYISTDYVFPGTGEQFYKPEDPTGPLNEYGKSKLAGEKAVQKLLDRYFIVRSSWAFGKHGENFLKTILRLSKAASRLDVVCDQVGSPTYTADLAPLLCDMAATDRYGVYHAVNEGVCSRLKLAQEVLRLTGQGTWVVPVLTGEYPAQAARPLNSRLNTEGLERAGFRRLPTWQDAVARYLREEGLIK